MRKIPGLEEAVKNNLAPIEGMALVRENGSKIATMVSTGDVEKQGIVSEFEIFRGTLSRLIVERSVEGDNEGKVEYVFNEWAVSMTQQDGDDGKTRVEFANTLQIQDFDLVIACDGATSRSRAMGLGCSVRDHIIPVGAWTASFSMPQNLLDGEKIGMGINAPGGKCLAVVPDNDGSSRVMSMNTYTSPGSPGMLAFREAQKKGEEEVKKLILKRYEGLGWKTSEILRGMQEAEDFYASEWCQVKVPELCKGRFVLCGDAGYAPGPTGTGTSLALTGAYILAGEISKHPDDLQAGLKAYEDKMRPIIDDMQVIPPGVLTIMCPQTAWGIWIRNFFFVVICWVMKYSSFFSWIGSMWGASFAGDKYGIPNYERLE